MNNIQDPRIANIVYNFLGNTLAQLNEIDKHNVGGSSLKALKTDPKNVFRVNSDPSLNLIPEAPIHNPAPTPQPNIIPSSVPAVNLNPLPSISETTVVAAPPDILKNINLNASDKGKITKEIDIIITALSNLKNIINESLHN